jgi:hypothetical protein
MLRSFIIIAIVLFLATISMHRPMEGNVSSGTTPMHLAQQVKPAPSATLSEGSYHGTKTNKGAFFAKSHRGDNLCSYVGPANGNWEVASNWSCEHVPTAINDVEIFIGTVTLNSDADINSLIIGTSAGLIITTGRNLTIKH